MQIKPKPIEAQPLLAGSELVGIDLPLAELRLPKLLSIKRNGIRGLCLSGKWRSRTMKQIQMHPLIAIRFEAIAKWAEENDMVLDGEFHSPTHNTVGETRSFLAGTKELPSDFTFTCFYVLTRREWNLSEGKMEIYSRRAASLRIQCPSFKAEEQHPITSLLEVQEWIKDYEDRSIEGFILIDPEASYKHGRSTKLEQISCKYKYYAGEEDAQIVGITPRRQRKADVEGGYRPDGMAQHVYTKDSFEETSVGGCLQVRLGDGTAIECPFPLGFGMYEREAAYVNFGTGNELDLRGKWVCFRRLACENRGRPMCIKNVQIRDDKE